MRWHTFLFLGLRFFPPFLFFLLGGLHCFFLYEIYLRLTPELASYDYNMCVRSSPLCHEAPRDFKGYGFSSTNNGSATVSGER
jgi:hypothetical protein